MSAKANIERKTRWGKWRAAALASVYLLMGFHIVHWKIYGNTLAPLEFNEVLYSLHLGIITAGFIFMGATIIGTLIFGRFFCSWACHILALQDFSEWLLHKLHIKPKLTTSRAFIIVPYATMLYLFIWPQINRIVEGREMTKFHIQTDAQGWASFVTNDFWRNLPSVPVTLLTFFVCGFAVIYFLGTRSFCQKVCPYGAVFSLADKVAPGKIKLTGDCNQCGVCTAHCSSHILVHKEIEQFGKVVNSDCLKDLDCVAVCPNDAIQYGFTKPSFFQSIAKSDHHKTPYSFSWSEDILLGILTLAFVIIYRGLYGFVPFLLAVTLAVLLAWFSVLCVRVFTKDYVTLGKIVLKQGNKINTTGRAFIVLMVGALTFSAHSAYVHYNNYRGDILYQAYLQNNGTTENQGAHKNILQAAKEYLQRASSWGLYSPLTLNRELAAIYLTEKDYLNAEKYLKKMLVEKPNDFEARLRLAKLYFVTNRENDAVIALQYIVTAKSIHTTAKEMRVLSDAHLTLGHIEEKNDFPSSALNHYRECLKLNPDNSEAMLALGVLLTRAGQVAEAEKYLSACLKIMPESALLHNNLSAVYLRLNKIEQASFHLQKLIQLQPENPVAYYNLGMIKLREGRSDESVILFKRALALKPDYTNAQIGLSMAENKKNTISKEKIMLQKLNPQKQTAQN